MPAKAKPPTFFKEKKEFISRMLSGGKPDNYALDMMTVKRIFAAYKGEEEFLTKVKPPFKMTGSIKYLLTADGKKYLKKKYNEFKFEIPEHEIPVDLGIKAGDDIVLQKPKTIRDFLS